MFIDALQTHSEFLNVIVGEAIVLNSLLYIKLKERLWEGIEFGFN